MNMLKQKILNEKIKYAKKFGYKLNPDKKILNFVISGLVQNKSRKRKEYCPCRPLENDPGKDIKKVCPCFWHRQEIKKDGHCHCRLFYKR
jgi:ferredoxin-thioredoxin reductase catalytic subunit